MIALGLVIGFQNCGPDSSRVGFSNSNKVASNLDSGTPYEGKIYATLGAICADGTEIESRIVMSSATKAELNRTNCEDIAPVQLTSADFQIDTVSDSLKYSGKTFSYIGNVAAAGITNLNITNDATNFYYGYTYEGKPNWLRIFLDTDNNPATGLSYNGIGADYLIENDYVWKYSAPAGSPANTWAFSSLVSSNKNNLAPNVSWSFAKSAIGSPAIIKVIAQTSLGPRTVIITQVPK